MMTGFYEVDTSLQIGLLVLSLLTVITLAGTVVLMLFYRSKGIKLANLILVFMVNTVLYVIMQLDSRITETVPDGHLQIPYVLLLLITAASMLLAVQVLLRQTRRRTTLNRASIKEAFDNLPTGVCFFNHRGLPVLCNLAMQRFSFAVCDRDVQFITDLEDCLNNDFVPARGVLREGPVYILPDGKVVQLEKQMLTYDDGETYTQFIATDITRLYESRKELTKDNEQLRKVQEDLKQMSANVVAVTREEEILSTKMRVHDDMGRCLMAAQKYLKESDPGSISDEMINSWHRAVSMLKHSNETENEDMLTQIRKTCEFFNLNLICTGTLPGQEKVAYLLTCALRECLTNAVRYAFATELYADFTETETEATVTITNNGQIPEHEIVEGGGLSTLRCRVERAGGNMTVESRPRFQLQVTVPKTKEDAL